MTQDEIRNVHEDIAYMKAMAQDGARGPLLGGAILVAAGIIFAAASVFHWAIDAGVVNLPPAAFSVLWIVAVAIFMVALFVLKSRLGGKPGAYSPTNRAASTAWMGVGLSSFVLGISIAVICWRTQTEAPVYLFPSVILALYGAGWAVSASMSGSKPLWWVAIAGWALAPVLAWLTGSPVQWLAYAVALLLLATAPGLVLMRQEPSEIV
ncbi:MAG TPA: hypothetical protein VGB49_03420 [Caulobacteraceae bacterium]|jgi:hypothetical protein